MAKSKFQFTDELTIRKGTTTTGTAFSEIFKNQLNGFLDKSKAEPSLEALDKFIERLKRSTAANSPSKPIRPNKLRQQQRVIGLTKLVTDIGDPALTSKLHEYLSAVNIEIQSNPKKAELHGELSTWLETNKPLTEIPPEAARSHEISQESIPEKKDLSEAIEVFNSLISMYNTMGNYQFTEKYKKFVYERLYELPDELKKKLNTFSEPKPHGPIMRFIVAVGVFIGDFFTGGKFKADIIETNNKAVEQTRSAVMHYQPIFNQEARTSGHSSTHSSQLKTGDSAAHQGPLSDVVKKGLEPTSHRASDQAKAAEHEGRKPT